MAIGPSAAHMRSGRIVVVATFYLVLGTLALLLGLGPLVVQSQAVERVVGATSVVAGMVLLVAGVALHLRVAWARRAGIVGGLVAVAIGSAIALGMIATISSGCLADGEGDASRCQPTEYALAAAGAIVALAGAASIVVVHRARPTYFGPRPRGSRQGRT